MSDWNALLALMDRLRDPGGCPWDREQSMQDLRSYLLEEAHEVVDAVDSGDAAALREELGDLLFQIVFLARIAKERGDFDAGDVLRGIVEKMVRRHPHVFGESDAATSEQVLRQWEEIKRAEKPADEAGSAVDGVPRSLPALLRAHRLAVKAARVGFDWPEREGALAKVAEELDEVRQALEGGEGERIGGEIGDLLFAAANLARHAGVDPESALQAANTRFARRFREVERRMREAGRPMERATLGEMDILWERVKQEERE